jgi:hypothetical protein
MSNMTKATSSTQPIVTLADFSHRQYDAKHGDEFSVSTTSSSSESLQYCDIHEEYPVEQKLLSSRVMSCIALNQVTGGEVANLPLKKRLGNSDPVFFLQSHANQMKKRPKRSESEFCMTRYPDGKRDQSDTPTSESQNFTKPEDHLQSLLKRKGMSIDMFLAPDDSFLPLTKQHIDAYPLVATAARNGDMETLKQFHQQGNSLQCSNAYGESIVHIVCRRGHDLLLRYLTRKAQVSLRVRDDLGRTPLHDAAWTNKPNFEIVRMILSDAPELLLVRDQRGHSAFSYVPRQRWGEWCKFLDEHLELIEAAVHSDRLSVIG